MLVSPSLSSGTAFKWAETVGADLLFALVRILAVDVGLLALDEEGLAGGAAVESATPGAVRPVAALCGRQRHEHGQRAGLETGGRGGRLRLRHPAAQILCPPELISGLIFFFATCKCYA